MSERVQRMYRFVLDDESELILNDKQIDELYADLESVIKQRATFRFVINTKGKNMGLTAAQESLGVEFDKVLHDNLFDLYEESPPSSSHGQAPAGATPVRETERDAFKAAHRHLELDEVPDAWGRPMFKHSHVEASWLGWISRAAQPSPSPQAEDTQQAPAQEAPAAVVGASEAVAYLDIGAGGYLDLGTDLADEALSRLPKGRHALVIAGTYGIDGYTAAPTTQPAPQQEAQEPVAWAFKYDDGTWHDPSTTEHSSGMRPLFAAPSPSHRRCKENDY